MFRSVLVGAAIVASASFGAQQASGLTFVLDFQNTGETSTTDIFGNVVQDWDPTDYGFLAGDNATIQAAILTELKKDYYGIPTQATLGSSPIPAGFELDIDFEIGEAGVAPTNGDSEWWSVQIGEGISGPQSGGTLGVAGGSTARNSAGGVTNFGLTNGDIIASVFTDAINGIGGVGTALTSGNLDATKHAINGTLAHEIGHTLSLSHINKAGVTTPNGLSPIMGTGAIDLPNGDRIIDREFALAGFNAQDSGTARAHIAQLVTAVGLRAVPEPGTAALLLPAILFGLRRRQA